MRPTDQDRARLERGRAKEADALETDVAHLDRERKRMVATARRLRAPIDVADIVARAKAGNDITQTEQAILATERPDVFNQTFERSLR
jgi:hypothetical protein